MDEEKTGGGKQKNFPEDVLNLELKYLDENVRPWMDNVNLSWNEYMKGKASAHQITVDMQSLLFQIIPVQRFTEHEVEKFQKRIVAMSKLARKNKSKEFNNDIITLINDIFQNIGDCKMFARPTDDDGTSGGFAALLKEVAEKEKKEEKEAAESG